MSARTAVRVLIVDDEPVLRRALSRALEQRGFEVLLAADGRSAAALLEEREVDVLLLDLKIPDVPGDTLFLAFTRRWSYLRDRVILMSGDIWSGRDAWPAELCACPVLAKPFTLDTLAGAIASVLAAAQAKAAPRREGNGH